MAARETKVFPVKDRTLAGVPAAVHVVSSKAEADALVASGAFTLNGHDADRLENAPDRSDEGPLTHENVRYLGEAPPDGADKADKEGPAETGGSSDSTDKE